MKGISGLRISTGDTTARRIPTTDEISPVDGPQTPDNLRRSDTADSLAALVGRSPSLSHVRDLAPLPSPLFPKQPTKTDRVEKLHSSPLSKSTPFHGATDEDEQPRPAHGLLPPKLFARLQDRSRHVSLNVEQPVSEVEMPRMVRHRSQSTVQRMDVLHREPTLSSQGHALRTKEVITLNYGRTKGSYTTIAELGQGTFSRVVLVRDADDALFAIKVVDLISEDTDRARIEMTVRREVDILERIHNPLLIHLFASVIQDDQAFLLLEYCEGGDLFTLASMHRSLLDKELILRIFAELVCVVHFLHTNNIIHRDLKLENVLLRAPPERIQEHTDLLICLTDLGLARAFDPLKPDIYTRCGSEDYAAPEIVMGQAYDGRQTDAWALGALLYCLLEGRLPFDVIPGLEHKMKTKVLHRICRIEWRWVALKDDDCGFSGAKRIVQNLLRSRTKRWSLDMVMSDPWLLDSCVRINTQM